MVARGLSLPPRARGELSRRRGRPPRLDDVYGTRRASSLHRWREHLVKAPARVADVAIDLLSRESFDLVWLNFAAAHKAGHHLWDPAAVVDAPLGAADQHALRGGLAEVYQAVDEAIGRVLRALPEDTDVIVFSPTGMAANTSRADLLPGMLDAVLHGPLRAPTAVGRAAQSPIWALRAAIPTEWREWLARALPDDVVADMATRLYLRRDWGHTRAIAVPGENKGYIRINLKGREREGSVDPAEMQDLLGTIASGLLTFRDPDGSPSVSKVERMSEIAQGGASVGRLPDLVVHWGEHPAAHLAHVASPAYGQVARRGVGSGRSGNHVDDAWGILLPARSRVRAMDRLPRITDIGATACGLFNADLTGLGGTSLFEPD